MIKIPIPMQNKKIPPSSIDNPTVPTSVQRSTGSVQYHQNSAIEGSNQSHISKLETENVKDSYVASYRAESGKQEVGKQVEAGFVRVVENVRQVDYQTDTSKMVFSKTSSPLNSVEITNRDRTIIDLQPVTHLENNFQQMISQEQPLCDRHSIYTRLQQKLTRLSFLTQQLHDKDSKNGSMKDSQEYDQEDQDDQDYEEQEIKEDVYEKRGEIIQQDYLQTTQKRQVPSNIIYQPNVEMINNQQYEVPQKETAFQVGNFEKNISASILFDEISCVNDRLKQGVVMSSLAFNSLEKSHQQQILKSELLQLSDQVQHLTSPNILQQKYQKEVQSTKDPTHINSMPVQQINRQPINIDDKIQPIQHRRDQQKIKQQLQLKQLAQIKLFAESQYTEARNGLKKVIVSPHYQIDINLEISIKQLFERFDKIKVQYGKNRDHLKNLGKLYESQQTEKVQSIKRLTAEVKQKDEKIRSVIMRY